MSGDINIDFERSLLSALRNNRSLKRLYFKPNDCRFNDLHVEMDLKQILTRNCNLVDLSLSFVGEQHWHLFRIVDHLKTLESLCLMDCDVDMESMEAIMMMCLAISSLQSLTFHECNCPESAVDFLARTLSSNKVLKALSYNGPLRLPSGKIEVDFGSLQVENLMFQYVRFDACAFNKTIDSIANNYHIKSLNLGPGVLHGIDDALEKVCDTLLRQNRGPSELILEVGEIDVSIMAEAMEGNTNLRTLKIDALRQSSMVSFVEGISNMTGLRKLAFMSGCSYSEDFFVALLESMEQNTSLGTLSFDALNVEETNADKYLPRIRCLLAINRIGRHRLMTVPIPLGLWAYLLERSSNERDGLYFALAERPEIVTPTRKRKHHLDEPLDN
jgi:hypothetical protein